MRERRPLRVPGEHLADDRQLAVDREVVVAADPSVFSRRGVPEETPAVIVPDAGVTLLELLRQCLPAESASSLRRLIRQGGVRVDGAQSLTDPEQRHPVSSGNVIRVGRRRWFRIVVDRRSAR